jgi:2-dehydro-3-deoxyphosphogluconate aldolase/(4S)-4-hydroxy-2-oxoglutarate aldolase
VLSPTELVRATALGVPAVKIFPAQPIGGPEYIRALRGPFPDVGLVPTGGIAVEEVDAYLRAGASAVGLGGALVGETPPRSVAELEALRQRAARAVELVRT